MVNRRHIRIKVMQSIYALLQSKNDDLSREKKFLNFSTEKAFDLYVLQLLLIVEVKNLALEHLEIKKKRYLATEEDKNPSLKFIENKVIAAIENSEAIKEFCSKKKLLNWSEHREFVRIILDKLQEQSFYSTYLKAEDDSFEQDKLFITQVFEKVVAPDEKLFDFYESLNLGWVDDYPLVNTWILKTFKQLKKNEVISLTDLVIREDDLEFLYDLFEKVMLHQHEFTEEINKKTPNWDADRIAEIDLILIKMALTEFLYFPSIPSKVSINEYIEIAKDYSTSKSSYFINGVLDKILKEYNQNNKIKKIGRGLL